MVQELNGNNFADFTKEGLTVVDFFADWCMPCVMMSPIMEELGENLKGEMKVAKVDVGENQELASKFQVSSIPNFVLFKNGKQIDQFVGAMPLEDFEEKLRKHL